MALKFLVYDPVNNRWLNFIPFHTLTFAWINLFPINLSSTALNWVDCIKFLVKSRSTIRSSWNLHKATFELSVCTFLASFPIDPKTFLLVWSTLYINFLLFIPLLTQTHFIHEDFIKLFFDVFVQQFHPHQVQHWRVSILMDTKFMMLSMLLAPHPLHILLQNLNGL